MKILIIGNEGYIGPIVLKRFKENYPESYIAGFDIGYFSHVITEKSNPEKLIDVQYRGDVREFPEEILKGFNVVIYLAAISNDPMGKFFEEITFDVNQHSAIKIAKAAKKFGVSHFVYASSCSVYGTADDKPRTEKSELNPLTAYAKSKVFTEHELQSLASQNFIITCNRFATACGFSPRTRLDLVLNDFVASAISSKKIQILSNGMPWRPLIHVEDMARVLDWSSSRNPKYGGNFLIVNSGSNKWNYTIKDLSLAVKKELTNVNIFINEDAEPDKRSYKVDFSLLKNLAGNYYPKISIEETVRGLLDGLKKIDFKDKNFRESDLIRLKVLKGHMDNKRLSNNLEWI